MPLATTYEKKNVKSTFGAIVINNSEPLGIIGNGMQVSPLLREHAVFVGRLDCYARSSEILSRFCSVDPGNTQIFRLTVYYGDLLGREEKYLERTLPPLASNEYRYAAVDGPMLPTREQGWNEAKPGRVFKSGDHNGKEGGPGGNLRSQYHARPGDSKTFIGEMDVLLATYGQLGDRLVLISDGANWIRTWLEETYPCAVTVLDFSMLPNTCTISRKVISAKARPRRRGPGNRSPC